MFVVDPSKLKVCSYEGNAWSRWSHAWRPLGDMSLRLGGESQFRALVDLGTKVPPAPYGCSRGRTGVGPTTCINCPEWRKGQLGKSMRESHTRRTFVRPLRCMTHSLPFPQPKKNWCSHQENRPREMCQVYICISFIY